MNTLEAYDFLIRIVTQCNQLAVKLRAGEITKTAALETAQVFLQKELQKID